MKTQSFGWDLAGYGSSYSAFCHAAQDGDSVGVTVLECDAICRPGLGMSAEVFEIAIDEAELLKRCCAIAPLVVDVPIDLAPLPDLLSHKPVCPARYYWQLVRRPVDHALGALTPLADRIGYAVARLANLLRSLEDSPVKLNATLFETYPAANLELLRQAHPDVRRVYDTYRWLTSMKSKALTNWPL